MYVNRFVAVVFAVEIYQMSTDIRVHFILLPSNDCFLIDSSPERVESRGSWKSKTTYFGVKLPGISSVGGQKRSFGRLAGSRSAPPGGATKTSYHHAVRRHMQNEYRKDVLNPATTTSKKAEDVTSW